MVCQHLGVVEKQDEMMNTISLVVWCSVGHHLPQDAPDQGMLGSNLPSDPPRKTAGKLRKPFRYRQGALSTLPLRSSPYCFSMNCFFRMSSLARAAILFFKINQNGVLTALTGTRTQCPTVSSISTKSCSASSEKHFNNSSFLTSQCIATCFGRLLW